MSRKLLFFGIIFLLSLPLAQATYPTGFQKCKEVTLYNPTGSSLTWFPINLNVTYDSDMQADFDDLRFYSGNCDGAGYPLYAELEWKVDSTRAFIFVKTNLSSGYSNISMYYKNSSVSSSWSSSTWDSNFVGVWHKNGTDSTSNSNNGVNRNLTYADSKVGKSFSTIGTSTSHVRVNDAGSLDLSTKGTFEIAITQKSYVSGASIIDKYITTGNQRSYRIRTVSTDEIETGFSTTGSAGGSNATTLNCGFTSSGTLVIVTVVYNGTGGKVDYYRNGKLCQTRNTVYTSLYAGTGYLYLGFTEASAAYANVTYDEVRISNELRSSSWINMTARLFISPNSYVTFGSEETGNPCAYAGSGHYTLSSVTCNITSNTNVQSGYMWNVTSSFIRVQDVYVRGYKQAHIKSGWVRWT